MSILNSAVWLHVHLHAQRIRKLPGAAGITSAHAQVMLDNETLDEDVHLAHVASRTEGFSGSDLKAVCTAAAMRPLRELLKASGKSAQVRLTLS